MPIWKRQTKPRCPKCGDKPGKEYIHTGFCGNHQPKPVADTPTIDRLIQLAKPQHSDPETQTINPDGKWAKLPAYDPNTAQNNGGPSFNLLKQLNDDTAFATIQTGAHCYLIEHVTASNVAAALQHYLSLSINSNIVTPNGETIDMNRTCRIIEITCQGETSTIDYGETTDQKPLGTTPTNIGNYSADGTPYIFKPETGELSFLAEDTLNPHINQPEGVAVTDTITDPTETELVKWLTWFDIHEFKERCLTSDATTLIEPTHYDAHPIWNNGQYVWEQSRNTEPDTTITYKLRNGNTIETNGYL